MKGIGVSPGRVIGPVARMGDPVAEPRADQPLSTTAELATEQLKAASARVAEDLKARASRASGDGKAVLEATALMASDPMLIKSAAKLIAGGASPERAMWDAAAKVAAQLESLGGYMAERVHDVYDVRSRIIAELRGESAPGVPESSVPFVLVAHDLAPADTATLDPAKVLALVTAEGGPQSHTAILARALGLPAVVAVHEAGALVDGAEVFVDGGSGEVVSPPTPENVAAATQWAVQAAELGSFDGRGQLADGYPVPLLANIGTVADARAAVEANAEGVGLFRTEFLFLDRADEPSVHEQVAAYRGVFDLFAGKKVVVRTLDAGADKPLPFLSDAEEPNPALGARGFRTELRTPGVLGRQLSAIAEAASGSDAEVWVMAPMVSTGPEAAAFKAMCEVAGLPVAGAMVEVPSAAINADHILTFADFASIGTNDLTQYTMAADRQVGVLAEFNDPWQPAVIAMVEATTLGAARAAKAAGANSAKPIGVCGEAAADPGYAVVLVGLGVQTLSMTARALPAVARVLATVTLDGARSIAAKARAAATAGEARAAVREELPVLEELGL
ncbi:phosphoenolpyruvate--protein phosphotransferase [Haematomicrobium sanguinis]|uniref:phosphoenolpyruvate--protein phosphotransferase n=1 Tax=Haematomicrobium sanguinis TaxID=479106 RepID=UPI00047A2D7A|nr:phosphoenolpyruvate--protein phosphotransferase [Haematomicrobium sanguinis]